MSVFFAISSIPPLLEFFRCLNDIRTCYTTIGVQQIMSFTKVLMIVMMIKIVVVMMIMVIIKMITIIPPYKSCLCLNGII